jgi:DNA-directed RNA polymerase I and III subunit RPAC1
LDLDQQKLYPNETILFKLDVVCSKNPNEDDVNPYINSNVYSRDLKWNPIGDQKKILGDVRPVHNDILIAKLRPGQAIHLECYVEKGIGKTHAKWSPVATASYRLLPEIEITKKFKQKNAEALVAKCPTKVFDIEDGEAVVKRPRDCTMCRECIREEGWEDFVKLGRVKDHFIFSIESVGIYAPEEIFRESLRIFYQKVNQVKSDLAAKKESQKKKVFQ